MERQIAVHRCRKWSHPWKSLDKYFACISDQTENCDFSEFSPTKLNAETNGNRYHLRESMGPFLSLLAPVPKHHTRQLCIESYAQNNQQNFRIRCRRRNEHPASIELQLQVSVC